MWIEHVLDVNEILNELINFIGIRVRRVKGQEDHEEESVLRQLNYQGKYMWKF